MEEKDFTTYNLGPRHVKSPIALSTVYGDSLANYVTDEELVLFDIDARENTPGKTFSRS